MRRALLRLAALWPPLATCPGARAHNVTGADGVAADPWSFLVVADPHKFSYLAAYDGANEDYTQEEDWQSDVALWRGIREARGGDLVLLVGDAVSFGNLNNLGIAEINGYTEPSREATYLASRNAARGARAFFAAVGYPTVLSTVGDHEIGGNDWFMTGCATCLNGKYYVVQDYRRGFAEGYNTASDGTFLFQDDIGGVPATPEGTEFSETSFAYVHKNALFVSVDAFHLLPEEYIDRELGYGGEGGITCNVTGAHLDWLGRILQVADGDPAIQHKFVQSHIPILHPVRKVRTSGQFMDGAHKSDFWKVMNKYNVDIYFAGDVHSNTASVSTLPGEDVVQVVTGANKFVGYTNLVVTDDSINVTLYRDVGGRGNITGNYHSFGRLTIDKSESPARVTSEGEFALIDPNSAIVKFEFEEIFPLNHRGVPGLRNSWVSWPQCPNGCMKIRGTRCTQSILNRGSFGSQYDAQVANIDLVPGPTDGELAAEFATDSIFAMYGVGPYTGGVPVSFALWIKTTTAAEEEMVLVHYGCPYNLCHHKGEKTHMTLTLKDGALVLHVLLSHRLGTVGAPSLNDGDWHRIGVSMPRQSCLLSEIEISIDGQPAPTALLHAGGDDVHIFHHTNGRMALGGFGNTAADYNEFYPLLRPFVGAVCGFSLWSSPLPPFAVTTSPVPAPNAQAPSILPSASLSASVTAPSYSPSQFPSLHTESPVLAANAHYVVCGNGSGYCEEGDGALVVDADLHEVRCCSDASLPGWTKRWGCGVWSQSEFDGQCYKNKTFCEASDICATVGLSARLCTVEELEARCTANSGCDLNKDLIWSSTAAGLSQVTGVAPCDAQFVATSAPSALPSFSLSSSPTSLNVDPSTSPPGKQSGSPSVAPSNSPSILPSDFPSAAPSDPPSTFPSDSPIATPSALLSLSQSSSPSAAPSTLSSTPPSGSPSTAPTSLPSPAPTSAPSYTQSDAPSALPSGSPSSSPSKTPGASPSGSPSGFSSATPSVAPSTSPSGKPSGSPSVTPSNSPSILPSGFPSVAQSNTPSTSPSDSPVVTPSFSAYYEFWLVCGKGTGCTEGNELQAGPAEEHQVRCCADTRLSGWRKRGNCAVWASSLKPDCHTSSFGTANELCEDAGGRLCTRMELKAGCTRGSGCSFDGQLIWSSTSSLPSSSASATPSADPSTSPSRKPSGSPSAAPSNLPSRLPSGSPSAAPSDSPSASPSNSPSPIPSALPSGSPSNSPSTAPSTSPSTPPSSFPSAAPTSAPSPAPTLAASGYPSVAPSASPSGSPSGSLSETSSASPSRSPSGFSSATPSVDPSTSPLGKPSGFPSVAPSNSPSKLPSGFPSATTSDSPTSPSDSPITTLSALPSRLPSSSPSAAPSFLPSTPPSGSPSAAPNPVPTLVPPSIMSVTPSASSSGSPSEDLNASPSGSPAFGPVTRSPSGAPSDSSPADEPEYHVVCGKGGGCPEGNEDVALAAELHEVRCCKDEYACGFETNRCDNLWAASDLGGCHSEQTYAEAEGICQENDSRLCTREEISNKCTRGSGCSFDNSLIWSSTQVAYHVVCGKGYGCPEGSEDVALRAELHEVRCCKDEHAYGFKTDRCDNLWAASDLGGCHSEQTYAEAEGICQENNSRLCTREEISNKCTRGSGCGFDNSLIWSSTPVASGPITPPPSTAPSDSPSADVAGYDEHYVVCGKGGGCAEGNERPAGVADEHPVRCCSDTEVQGWTKRGNYGCTVWASSLAPGCHTTLFATARDLCEDVGARLCTKPELAARCTRGSGCGFDNYLVWSSSSVLNPPSAPPVWPIGLPSAAPSTTAPTTSHFPSTVPSMDPSVAPRLVPNAHYVVCGKGNDHCEDGDVALAADAALHEVRCCSEASLPGWTKKWGCGVWTQSNFDGQCYEDKSYCEALDICARVSPGVRLCTKTELEAKCTKGSGCGMDDHLIWSSTEGWLPEAPSAVPCDFPPRPF